MLWTRIALYDVNFKDDRDFETIGNQDPLSKSTWASANHPGRLCHRQLTIGHLSSCQGTYSAYLQSHRATNSVPVGQHRDSHSVCLRPYPRQPLGIFQSSPRQPPGVFLSYLSQASQRHTHQPGPCCLLLHSHTHVLVSHIVLARFVFHMLLSMWEVRHPGST